MTDFEIKKVEEVLTNCIRAIESIDLSKKRSAERQKRYVERYHALESELAGMQLLLQKMGYIPYYHFAEADDTLWNTSLSYYTIEKMQPPMRFFKFEIDSKLYDVSTSEDFEKDYRDYPELAKLYGSLDEFIDEKVKESNGELTEISKEEYHKLKAAVSN